MSWPGTNYWVGEMGHFLYASGAFSAVQAELQWSSVRDKAETRILGRPSMLFFFKLFANYTENSNSDLTIFIGLLYALDKIILCPAFSKILNMYLL